MSISKSKLQQTVGNLDSIKLEKLLLLITPMNFSLTDGYIPLALAIIASLFVSSCANFTLFGPRLIDSALSTGLDTDYRPRDSTNIFYIDSPQVCCSTKLSSSHENTTALARWVFEKNEAGENINKVVLEDTKNQVKDGYLGFVLNAPPQGFSDGQYRLDLYIDGGAQSSIPFSIKSDQSGSLPEISHFYSEQHQIIAGETSKLSWSVAGAGRLSIEPSPGAVASEGSIDVAPTADTTYTLWAVNRRGSSSSQISLTVVQPVKGKADLVITDFWTSGNVLSYRIKNIGNLASCATESYLYKNDILVSNDYVEPLAPGEERGGSFAKYHFSPRFSSYSASLIDGDSCYMRVCANADRSCPESDYTNDCFEHNFGPLLNFDLLQFAANAQWQSSSDSKSWLMYTGSEVQIGTAQVKSDLSYQSALLMRPPASGHSWIQGTFGVPLGAPVELRPFTIPHDCKFTTYVGLTTDTPAAAQVRFILGTSQGGTTTYFPPVTVNSGGEPATYAVDLSGLAGQKVLFILRVESDGPLPEGSAAWIEPVISQQR